MTPRKFKRVYRWLARKMRLIPPFNCNSGVCRFVLFCSLVCLMECPHRLNGSPSVFCHRIQFNAKPFTHFPSPTDRDSVMIAKLLFAIPKIHALYPFSSSLAFIQTSPTGFFFPYSGTRYYFILFPCFMLGPV